MLSLKAMSVKNLMAGLLAGDLFEGFLLQQARIQTAVTYTIDGRLNTEFYPLEERTPQLHPYEFQPWSEAREIAYQLIKGKNTPVFFQFVLQLKPDQASKLLKKEYPDGDYSAVRALLLTIRYDGQAARLTTGTSYTSFVLDRTPDQIWDRAVSKFLGMKGIDVEVL